MSVAASIVLWCEVCWKATIEPGRRSVAGARAKAAREGWVYRDRKDICPNCVAAETAHGGTTS